MTVPNKLLVATLALAAFGAIGVAGTRIQDVWNRDAMNARIGELESEIQKLREGNQSWSSEIARELNMIHSRMADVGEDSRQTAEEVRKEQAQRIALLRKSIDEHAQAVAVQQQRSEEEIAQTVDAKVGGVLDLTFTQIGELSGQVGKVNADVDMVKTSVDVTRIANRQEIGEVRDSLGRQIAQNTEELLLLKRGGERDLYEFDLRKSKDVVRLAGIGLQLTGTDTKGKKYDVNLMLDDDKVQKKGQLINEPLQFQVGSRRIRYELVVNAIDKDRVRGFISATKPVIAADGRQPLGPVIRN
jgi:type I site-specific restriction endonuclease